MFGEFKKDLQDACWTGYKQVGMKDKGGKKYLIVYQKV